MKQIHDEKESKHTWLIHLSLDHDNACWYINILKQGTVKGDHSTNRGEISTGLLQILFLVKLNFYLRLQNATC